MLLDDLNDNGVFGPSPHGEGGLKCGGVLERYADQIVPPHTGRVD